MAMSNTERRRAYLRARMSDRLLAAWSDSTTAQREAGELWYLNALRACHEIAHASGLAVDQVTGVMAALSPRATWSVNMVWAAETCIAARDGKARPAVGINGLFARRAWEIATNVHVDPLDVLSGPKVRDFYAAIGGDRSIAVIDTWAARTAYARFDVPGIHPARYRLIQSAYLAVAETIGEHPRTLQATLWVRERKGSE